MSSVFQVSLVVEGFSFSDDDLDCMFEVLPDAVPSSIGGLDTVAAPVEAPDSEAACMNLAGVLAETFPSITIVRVDPDFVSISDIAERTGRSRESVRLLVEGKRGPGSFPAPTGIIGDGSRFWSWAIVVDWFASHMKHDIDLPGVLPEVAAVVDACLAGRRRMTRYEASAIWSTIATVSYHIRDVDEPRAAISIAS